MFREFDILFFILGMWYLGIREEGSKCRFYVKEFREGKALGFKGVFGRWVG